MNFFLVSVQGWKWYSTKIFQNLQMPKFDDLFITARQYMYGLMCGLQAYGKLNNKSTDATSFGGGRNLPEFST